MSLRPALPPVLRTAAARQKHCLVPQSRKAARANPSPPIARIGNCRKRSLQNVLGGGKSNFLIRDIDGPAMTAAPRETCLCATLKSPRGRLRSVLDVRNRLRRMRERSHRWLRLSTGPLRSISIGHDLPKISIQSSLGSSKYGRMRRKRLPDLCPIPEGDCEPICIRKK